MCIDHTKLTHEYQMVREEAPMREVYGIRLTMKHIVTGCIKYKLDRERIGMNETLDIASLGPETEDNLKMIDFLKVTKKLYNLI